jgi:hypothetical protein
VYVNMVENKENAFYTAAAAAAADVVSTAPE